jgi:hypothetical protein
VYITCHYETHLAGNSGNKMMKRRLKKVFSNCLKKILRSFDHSSCSCSYKRQDCVYDL